MCVSKQNVAAVKQSAPYVSHTLIVLMCCILPARLFSRVDLPAMGKNNHQSGVGVLKLTVPPLRLDSTLCCPAHQRSPAAGGPSSSVVRPGFSTDDR